MSRLAGTPEVVIVGGLAPGGATLATARLLGGRILTGRLVEDAAFVRAAGAAGLTFLFRYGVAVTFGAAAEPAEALDALLAPHVLEPADFKETETASLIVRGGREDRIDADGQLILVDDSRERLLLVATVLAHSVVLARDETLVSQVFERIAPVVAELRETGQAGLSIREVKRLVGAVLSARHRVTGTVQVGERPDLLWDHPELDRLYARLEAEYELKDREEVLERKFGTLGDFAEAMLNIVQDKRAFRLEAAIIALIAFELVLNLVEMMMR